MRRRDRSWFNHPAVWVAGAALAGAALWWAFRRWRIAGDVSEDAIREVEAFEEYERDKRQNE